MIDTKMIATCGMNCAVCIGHLRERNKCAGCNGDDNHKLKHCVICRIKNCEMLIDAPSHFCFECEKFPCARLKQLDKRYRTKYGMSMIENLENIKNFGLKKFITEERIRWTCSECGGIICVHRGYCYQCGEKKK